MSKHIQKATSINETLISKPDKKVFGILYKIEGIGAASSVQFYITDSTKNFVRGALYFEVAPNNDSLKPVIEFVNKDISKFIDSFEWRK